MAFISLNTAFAAREDSPAANAAASSVVLDKMLVSGEQPGPGMWKVTKGDHTLWIIGTQTPVPEKMTWRAKGLEAIVAQSQEILSAPSASVSMKQIGFFTMLTMLPSALQVRKNPDDATLRDLVPAELHARWLVLRDKYIDSYTINDEEKNIENWRPMFAAVELYRKAISKSGLTSASPVWPVIREAASKYRVKITQVRYEPAISEPRAALKELRSTRLADVDCFAKTV
ncbi:MAG: TraB/GumN family protein, partial [Betaproteobacteria bacterium]